LYISRFYNQINFFITLINGGDFEYCGGDFDKCGGEIDGGDFAVGRFDLNPNINFEVTVYSGSVVCL